MNEMLNVISNDGNSLDIKVIKKFKLDNYPDKEYIAYTLGEENNGMTQAFVSTVTEKNNTYVLEAITNNDEWNEVQNGLNELLTNQQNKIVGDEE